MPYFLIVGVALGARSIELRRFRFRVDGRLGEFPRGISWYCRSRRAGYLVRALGKRENSWRFWRFIRRIPV